MPEAAPAVLEFVEAALALEGVAATGAELFRFVLVLFVTVAVQAALRRTASETTNPDLNDFIQNLLSIYGD
jgi:hypothetical protein